MASLKMARALPGLGILVLLTSVVLHAQEAPKTGPAQAGVSPTTLPDGPARKGPVELLSDTEGIDFSPYMARVIHNVKIFWDELVPQEAEPPLLKQGTVVIEFTIMKDGTLSNLHYVSGSGDVAMDRAAYGGITSYAPFPPLPSEFTGGALKVRFTFAYNPERDNALAERVRLSEILVSTQHIPAGDDQQIAAARLRAEGLLAQIQWCGLRRYSQEEFR